MRLIINWYCNLRRDKKIWSLNYSEFYDNLILKQVIGVVERQNNFIYTLNLLITQKEILVLESALLQLNWKTLFSQNYKMLTGLYPFYKERWIFSIKINTAKLYCLLRLIDLRATGIHLQREKWLISILC
jgi:hypothetical protein